MRAMLRLKLYVVTDNLADFMSGVTGHHRMPWVGYYNCSIIYL